MKKNKTFPCFLFQSTSRSEESLVEDSGENPKENFEENFEERSADGRKDNLSEEFSRTSEKASFNDSVQSVDSRGSVNGKSVPSVSASICSSSLSAEDSGVKTGCELDDVTIDESFAQNAAPKKQKKKVRTFSLLGINCVVIELTEFAIHIFVFVP